MGSGSRKDIALLPYTRDSFLGSYASGYSKNYPSTIIADTFSSSLQLAFNYRLLSLLIYTHSYVINCQTHYRSRAWCMAWHGSWCWKFQIPALEALGYAVEMVDLPCVSGVSGTTQFDDADHVRSVVESQISMGKRVVVLAHSYGGPIASAAIKGLSGNGVLGMIALSAFIFHGGMDQGAAIRDIGGLPYVMWDVPSEGLFQAKDPRGLFFPPDVSADLVDWAVPQLRPQSMAANMGIVPPQAWQDDSYTGRLGYIRCTADVVIPIEQQDAMVEGAGGQWKWVVRTLEGSGHSPFLSRPHEVAAALEEMVNAFEARI